VLSSRICADAIVHRRVLGTLIAASDESIAVINPISGYQSGRTTAVKIKPSPLDQHQHAVFEFDNLD
jgi:hypothetical protein